MCSTETNFRFHKCSTVFYSTSEVLIWHIYPHHFHFTVVYRYVYVRNKFSTKTHKTTQPDTKPYKYTRRYVVTFVLRAVFWCSVFLNYCTGSMLASFRGRPCSQLWPFNWLLVTAPKIMFEYKRHIFCTATLKL